MEDLQRNEIVHQIIGMFEVLEPAKLVLTMQPSTAPFVIESAFVLVLTILFAAPLIARAYYLLVRASSKLFFNLSYRYIHTRV